MSPELRVPGTAGVPGTADAFTGLANGTTNITTNGLNELATVGGVTATSDARGNLTYAGTGTFAYDAANKLTSVTTGGVAANALYDPLDRLTQMWGTGVSDFTFLTDPGFADAVVAQYGTGSGALQARHVFAGVNEPIVSYDASGNRTWLAADERGSIIAEVDASGAATGIYTYDEYGVPGASNAGRFGYTGQVRLPEFVEPGLYYYKNRMYAAGIGGRFPQTDPIGFAGGANLYAYVLNDPVNLVDPLGLDCANPPNVNLALDGSGGGEDCSPIVITAQRLTPLVGSNGPNPSRRPGGSTKPKPNPKTKAKNEQCYPTENDSVKSAAITGSFAYGLEFFRLGFTAARTASAGAVIAEALAGAVAGTSVVAFVVVGGAVYAYDIYSGGKVTKLLSGRFQFQGCK